MGDFPLLQGKRISQGLELWVQVLQVGYSWQIKQQQEGQIRFQDLCV